MDALNELLPPPKEPLDSKREQDWIAIEKELGLTLPGDYKQYISTYGSGKISDFLWIFNPFSKNKDLNLAIQAKKVLEVFRSMKTKYGISICPYQLFPEPDGLFPIGYTDNGDDLFWLTKGAPEEWRIIIHQTRSANYEEYKGNLSNFLTELLSGKLKSNILPVDLIQQNRIFIPPK